MTFMINPGVYELPTGEIYVVKPSKDKTRVYAKRLVEAPSLRLTERGEVVDFDFEYEKGAIWRIQPKHLMPLERAKHLMIRYGRCIVCGRTLKGFIGKRVRLCFYIGEGSGIQNYTEIGYIRSVEDHRVVMEADPKVKGRYPILRTTFLTEFVAIYGVDELDPEKPIVEEDDKGGG